MVRPSGGDWRGALEGTGGVEAKGFVDGGVEGGKGGEGSGVRVRRRGAGFRGVGGAEGESRVRVVAVVSEAATTVPEASPLSQLRSGSRVWVLRAASMSQGVMLGIWPLGWGAGRCAGAFARRTRRTWISSPRPRRGC